jgi:hypothetical protein
VEFEGSGFGEVSSNWKGMGDGEEAEEMRDMAEERVGRGMDLW